MSANIILTIKDELILIFQGTREKLKKNVTYSKLHTLYFITSIERTM